VLWRAAGVAVITVVVGAQGLEAQGPGAYGAFWQRPFHVGVDAGASFPTGQFGDRFDPGWIIGANVAKPLSSHGGIWLQGDFSYAAHQMAGATAADYGATGGSASITSGTLNLVLNKRDYFGRVTPYLLFGGGAYWRAVDLDNYGASAYCSAFVGFCGPYGADVPLRTRTQFTGGADAGGGLRFRLPPVRLFVEARYNTLYGHHGNTDYVPLVLGAEW
jgi:hypothetical protein